MARRAPRRIYILVLAALVVAFIALVGVYLQIGRPVSPTSTTAVGQAGVPQFQYTVAGPSGGAFRLRGVAIAGSKAFIADSDGGRLVVIDLARGKDSTFTYIPIAPDRQYETIPKTPQPISVAVSPDGTLLVTDLANGRLWRVAQDGSLLGDFPDPKERERSKLTSPAGVAVGGDEVFVSDVADHQIKVYSMGGRFLRSFGEPGIRPGQFSFVNGLAVGRDGNLYVADSNNRRVQVVDKQGAPVAVLDKTDRPEGMGLPRAVAVDRFGRVHVADTFAKSVYVYRDAGVPVFVYGRGPEDQQTLDLPEGIAVSDDTIVVSDGGNRRVMVFSY
jgi:DNA-binding beta-propeller fold protein YncE